MTPGEPRTYVERFVLRERIDSAAGRMVVAFFGAPAVAAAWAFTCAQARALEAGSFRYDSDPRGIVFQVLWVGLHARFGMAGLHVIFGCALAAILGVGLFGWTAHRRIRSEFAPELLRDLRLESLRSDPALRRAIDGARQRTPSPSAEPPGTAVLIRLIVLAVPLGSIALTAWLVWRALRA
jgi:hypothetical protein